MLTLIDSIAIWTGRIFLITLLLIFLVIAIWWFYIYFFKLPYCPKCGSRKTEHLIGNNAGGYRCSRCDVYYWYENGRSHLEDPIGFFERMVRNGTMTKID